jgi:hypothetical protein
MPGSYKVKVVMDNCRLEESNEVLIAPETISPGSGSIDGENIIYIYCDFDYAPLSSYVDKGLVAHFDGINNRGLGDKRHSFDADDGWIDLKSGDELPRGEADGQWLSNGFQVLGNPGSKQAFSSLSIPDAFPTSNDPRTIEVIFRTPIPEYMFEIGGDRRIFDYGADAAYSLFAVMYRGVKNAACDLENQWVFLPIAGHSRNMESCLSSTPSLMEPNRINTVTSTYANSIADTDSTNSYINNTPATIVTRPTGPLNTSKTGHVLIGQNLPSTFLSVRLYNRVLKPAEIATNAALDQIRYLNPPKVTIGGNECTEVVVLSSNFLMCKVPPGDDTGLKDVKVESKGVTSTYNGAYEYVPGTAFYIDLISPILGSAGETLTLTGNNLDTITELEVGGNVCPSPTTQTSIKYECELPALAAGEVDIKITTTGGKTYRFAKVFEYQD